MERKEVTAMKKLLIGTLVSAVASLGIWAGLGNIASAKPVAVKARPAHAVVAAVTKAAPNRSGSEDPSGTDTDNVQSGDQTSPDTGTPTEGESSGEGTTTETDGVDCQQDGNFDGVNAAGTGPGCDGSGT